MQSIHFRQIGTSIYQGPKRIPSLSMLLFALLLLVVLSLDFATYEQGEGLSGLPPSDAGIAYRI